MSLSRCTSCGAEIWYVFTVRPDQARIPALEVCQACRLRRSRQEKARARETQPSRRRKGA